LVWVQEGIVCADLDTPFQSETALDFRLPTLLGFRPNECSLMLRHVCASSDLKTADQVLLAIGSLPKINATALSAWPRSTSGR
jgi:hypothetical protein